MVFVDNARIRYNLMDIANIYDKKKRYKIFSEIVNILMRTEKDKQNLTAYLLALMSVVNDVPIDIYHSQKNYLPSNKEVVRSYLQDEFFPN